MRSRSLPRARRRRGAAGHAVGVDLGGTWLRVLAEDAGGRRRAHREPAPGPAALPGRLRALWRRWRFAPRDVTALVVASRGVWTGAERRAAARRLRGLGQHVRVIADVEAALLGALGDGPGILLLAGTGSIALGRDSRGRLARAGGLGPLLGDEGSAFWIGREWLRRAGQATDARLRGLARRPDAVARIAALAPAVLRRARPDPRARRGGGHGPRDGVAVARRVTREAQRHLAGLIVDVLRRLRLGEPTAVSWAGGLLGQPVFRRGVWRAARRQGARLSPAPPRSSPLAGALAVARGSARLTGGGTQRTPAGP